MALRRSPAHEDVRLAELVASMSLATDLGLGQPMEHVVRSCLVGLRLGELLGLEESDRAVVYYVALGRLPRGFARAGCLVRRRHHAPGRRARNRHGGSAGGEVR